MASALVRISAGAHATLKQLARARRESMQAVLESAVEEYRRRRFLEEVNRAYGALRAHDSAWAEWGAELGEWETTLADGLPREQPPAAGSPASASKKRARRR
jgi:hypothetical protein